MCGVDFGIVMYYRLFLLITFWVYSLLRVTPLLVCALHYWMLFDDTLYELLEISSVCDHTPPHLAVPIDV